MCAVPRAEPVAVLAEVRFKERSDNLRHCLRTCSNRLTCVPPCFPRDVSRSSVRPSGVVTVCGEPAVEDRLSSSGLPAQACAVLCPRLTPWSDCSSRASPDKNANSSCTIPTFTVSSKLRASVRCATLPDDTALYAVSVRGPTALIQASSPWFLAVPQLPFSSIFVILITEFTYRGL